MSNLFIKETWINATEKCCIGDSDWFESRFKTVKEVFNHYRKQGKIQKMYNGGIQTGYVVTLKRKYEDTGETYTAEDWIEISKTEPRKVCKWENVTNPFK